MYVELFHKDVLEHAFTLHELSDSVGSCAVLQYDTVVTLLLVSLSYMSPTNYTFSTSAPCLLLVFLLHSAASWLLIFGARDPVGYCKWVK